MSISKKILLVSLVAKGSFYAVEKQESTIINNNSSIFPAKPAKTEKTLINRAPTVEEIKLANAQAALQLKNLDKSNLQIFGENLDKNMKYLCNAQPFGVEHGLVKGAGIVALLIVTYKLSQYFHKGS